MSTWSTSLRDLSQICSCTSILYSLCLAAWFPKKGTRLPHHPWVPGRFGGCLIWIPTNSVLQQRWHMWHGNPSAFFSNPQAILVNSTANNLPSNSSDPEGSLESLEARHPLIRKQFPHVPTVVRMVDTSRKSQRHPTSSSPKTHGYAWLFTELSGSLWSK